MVTIATAGLLIFKHTDSEVEHSSLKGVTVGNIDFVSFTPNEKSKSSAPKRAPATSRQNENQQNQREERFWKFLKIIDKLAVFFQRIGEFDQEVLEVCVSNLDEIETIKKSIQSEEDAINHSNHLWPCRRLFLSAQNMFDEVYGVPGFEHSEGLRLIMELDLFLCTHERDLPGQSTIEFCGNSLNTWTKDRELTNEYSKKMFSFCSEDTPLVCQSIGYASLKEDDGKRKITELGAEALKLGCQFENEFSCLTLEELGLLKIDSVETANHFKDRCAKGSVHACQKILKIEKFIGYANKHALKHCSQRGWLQHCLEFLKTNSHLTSNQRLSLSRSTCYRGKAEACSEYYDLILTELNNPVFAKSSLHSFCTVYFELAPTEFPHVRPEGKSPTYNGFKIEFSEESLREFEELCEWAISL